MQFCIFNLSPTEGHEQSGYRPAVVVSNDFTISTTNMVYIAPITNTVRNFPLHVSLDARTKTTGEVLCEQARAVDLKSRPFTVIERVPDDILDNILECIISCLENEL